MSDLALIGMSCAYAYWLAEHKELEPNWTWVEVVFGVGYCLAHARVRLRAGDDGLSEAARSLALGAIPIIAGEIAQWLRRERIIRDLIQKWG